MDRRSFIQFLGIGGVSLASNPAFGQSLWVPDQEELFGGHLVLIRKPGRFPRISVTRRIGFMPDGAWESFLYNTVAQYSRRTDNRIVIPVILEDGEDPVAAFHRAVLSIQEDFREKAILALSEIPEKERAGLCIVTLVDNPIFVGPLPHYDPRLYELYGSKHFLDPSLRGFTVELDHVQFFSEGKADPGDWEVYSETGECPIEFPAFQSLGL